MILPNSGTRREAFLLSFVKPLGVGRSIEQATCYGHRKLCSLDCFAKGVLWQMEV